MSDDQEAYMAKLQAAGDALLRIARGQSPSPAELAAAPRLDFWTLGTTQGWLVLQGVVTGHPELEDGARIQSSALLWLSDDRRVARTLSRFYRLGVPLLEAMPRQG